ncbi:MULTISPECIES: carbonate dehydratase [Pseudomonadaceae]|uniref:Carbonic anhydrase n=2 Tax=Aquipseudomonas alcaligenes TaxID=43263 RepID=A0A5C7W797_AQUAC|nr:MULTISPECIES: carbonate dehydratase [Pseudomonas]MDC7826338.1 carbonate dehydratase [Pseudomonas sp. BLCC-B13]MDH0141206.1 carbonate dehydratase [Pseudomonas alcaligenes]MDH1054560.1 carbonate dehydratase [Pseudomonas alcaligenes]MEE1951391.1 carbonate dehydratase [Pseudomonas alcaligenes]NMY40241.1 carbonate dehydratase [Pseudomonas sp. WS 5013]
MEIKQLLANNRFWSEALTARDPDFFARLARQQRPEFLWIGCSDSRVPANEVVGLMPGELFVHRNVANMVVATDMNFLSVLQYAVDVLQVRHVIVCGHYGCGGVRAALGHRELGLIDNWLRALKAIHHQNLVRFDGLDDEQQVNLLCELNVQRQVRNVCHTTIVQNAWQRGQPLAVHGWIYGLADGLVKDLQVTLDNASQLDSTFLYDL